MSVTPIKRDNYDYLVKILILGDSSVGKTNILTRYTDNKFAQTHMPTIGIDFKIKTIQIDDKHIKMQIWDTAGQERFKTIINTYYVRFQLTPIFRVNKGIGRISCAQPITFPLIRLATTPGTKKNRTKQ